MILREEKSIHTRWGQGEPAMEKLRWGSISLKWSDVSLLLFFSYHLFDLGLKQLYAIQRLTHSMNYVFKANLWLVNKIHVSVYPQSKQHGVVKQFIYKRCEINKLRPMGGEWSGAQMGQHSPNGISGLGQSLRSSQTISSHRTVPVSHTQMRQGSGFHTSLSL